MRFHLFEFEDQRWFPAIFRNFITDHLEYHTARLYQPILPKLNALLSKYDAADIVDLCSGAGGPLPCLVQQGLLADKVVLTDLYPNKTAFQTLSQRNTKVQHRNESVSAFNCPHDLTGIRTLFTGLHHFKPDGVVKILQDAQAKNAPIALFEFTERAANRIIPAFLLGFIMGILDTHKVKNRSWGRMFFTYLLPLAPLFYWWDGIVSNLRTYTVDELTQLVKDADPDGKYDWDIGKLPAKAHLGKYHITHVIGMPKVKHATNALRQTAQATEDSLATNAA